MDDNIITSEAEGRASSPSTSGIFHIERPGPTRPDRNALWRLISLEPCIRLGSGFLYWIAPSFNKWVRPVPLHLGGNNSTWHVLREGCQESSTCYFSTMAGPIGLKLGLQAGTHNTCPCVNGGVLQHVRTCLSAFHISGTATSFALKF